MFKRKKIFSFGFKKMNKIRFKRFSQNNSNFKKEKKFEPNYFAKLNKLNNLQN